MKGSHSVDSFLGWLRYSTLPDSTKVRLARQIRKKADLCSATGGQALIEFKQPAERGEHIVFAIRVFNDGSLTLGYPEDAKWYGTPLPQLFPPPEEEL